MFILSLIRLIVSFNQEYRSIEFVDDKTLQRLYVVLHINIYIYSTSFAAPWNTEALDWDFVSKPLSIWNALSRYNSSAAYSSITAALKAGFTMIDTALDYHNQDLTQASMCVMCKRHQKKPIKM